MISIVGLGTPKAFSAIISNVIPDVQLQANGQGFPKYLYEEDLTTEHTADTLVAEQQNSRTAEQQNSRTAEQLYRLVA